MQIRYTVLSDKSGILRDRNLMLSDDGIITLVFDGKVPPCSTVIIKDLSSDTEYYRALDEEQKCEIDTTLITKEHTLRPYVTVLDENYKDNLITCEAIRLVKVDDEKILVSDEADFINIVNSLREDNEAMREEIQAISEKYDRLEQKLADLFEGYDSTL